ncbi:MAG: hypothetical protein JRI71_10980 [Deltaproteobacteria bacterium]|nr:hypothetical protein [Deltaproteobacteria bacterium]MBW2078050.1 hypothetical protein [Deltaproteobacteria bacterium]MBW2312353.1 hypothetical protein [Deltaproteobacteria bacterium]RLB22233.1 MAG: hypothetical protein DRG73_07245 [Deltaproteobacteria bacterium]
MKGIQKADLLEVIDKSAEELHQRIDMHRYLMATILDKKVSENRLNNVLLPDPRRELELKETIRETIEVLEETRKAFKSKRLEVLRKRLINVLTEF